MLTPISRFVLPRLQGPIFTVVSYDYDSLYQFTHKEAAKDMSSHAHHSEAV